jgi:hypothetical protein
MSLIPGAGSESKRQFQDPVSKGKAGDFELTVSPPNSARTKETPQESTPNPISIQKVDENSPPRVSHQATKQSQTPLQNKSLSAISAIVFRKGPFTDFNAIADELKSQKGWQEAINSQVLRLNPQSIAKLISIPLVDLRGYDRELLLAIFQAVKDRKGCPAVDERIGHLETKVITVDKQDMKVLGGGAVNTVYSVKYVEPTTKEKVEAVFKPEPSELDSTTVIKEQLFGTATASGIPPGIESHLPSRAVASSFVDRLLYANDTISVKTEFAIVNGKRGILMQKASGKSPKVIGEKKEAVDLNAHPKVKMFLLRRLHEEGSLTTQDAKFFAAVLKLRSVEIAGDIRGKWVLTGTSATVENFDPNNPTTAEGLLKLQVKDIITGECDRHPQNYFIAQDGKVTGIDEDCCFGVHAIPEKGDVRKQDSLKFLIPNNASLMLRMPPVVTKEIKEQIDRLHANPDQLRKGLEPFISKAEIDATETRLQKLHDHVNSEAYCLVVDTKEELVSTEARKRMDTNNSYAMREALVYAKDQKGWNYLRAHREY